MTDTRSTLLDRSAPADDGSGCRRWLGSHNREGYGTIKVQGRSRLVHAVAYELWVGPIPDGNEIDHVKARGCRHRDCLAPGHLEAVVHAENMLRARRTHCRRNHPLTGDNLLSSSRPGGGVHRECRTCRNGTDRARYQRQGDRRPELAASDPRHGTRTGYANHGCRCTPCKDANRCYVAQRKVLAVSR